MDSSMVTTDILRICAAIAAGGLIGLEREFRDKSAGFRTLIFIGAGSALFTILSKNLAPDSDPNRIAANIVTGIGFLGAGAILRDGMRVAGLTTAAAIWLTSAIGMAFGAGEFLFGGFVTLISLVVLWVFPAFEHAVDKIREEHTYDLIIADGRDGMKRLEASAAESGLKFGVRQYYKESAELRCRWVMYGKPRAHEKLIQQLLDDPAVREFKY